MTIKQKDFELKFSGAEYLFQFGLPNFYFHIVTAYDILRHLGMLVARFHRAARAQRNPLIPDSR
ncbi:MAG: hypothetical protein CBARDCOR_1708 [uncultured Caballeronia sp.]|nr:MAG: hypothetical protein CBARDCOR_1708 [uncultured Caballeronia sp.]